jgi:AcrR family transcriptional regulator
LLDAARRLVVERGLDGASLRAIATEAGTTAAMVAYYFGNKEGLRRALVEAAFAEIFAAVGPAVVGGIGPAKLVGIVGGLLADRPWLRSLMLREILADGGSARDLFVERFATHGAALVPQLVEREVAAGRWRGDLDPTLMWISIVALAAFPFLARPVLEAALGQPLGDGFVTRFAAHTEQLLLLGVRAEERA